jgi:hypothetical protein
MIADCFKYYKGCQVCQKFGDLQLVPARDENGTGKSRTDQRRIQR